MDEQGLQEHIARLLSEPQACWMCDQGPSKDRELVRGKKGYICNACVWSLARSMAKWPSRQPNGKLDIFPPMPVIPTLRELVRVVPVGLTAMVDGIEVTLLSVELYADGFTVNGRIVAENPDEADSNVEWTLIAMPQTPLTVDDDRGGIYSTSGGHGGGDRKVYRFGQTFGPALDPEARELRFTIADLRQIRFDPQAPDDRSRDLMRPGPWVFTVDRT